ncbi:hypothetical protein V8C44DRAFT_345482, partial [Trichoderma aethiopicum]
QPSTGSRSSRVKQLSIQQKLMAFAAILADGYAIINQGGFDGSFGNQSERRIL